MTPEHRSARVVPMGEIAVSEALTFWTAPHPAWRPNPEWPEDVGFVSWCTCDACVLIDPLVRDDLDSAAWAQFDREVEDAQSVVVLLTAPWHERSMRAVMARYDAAVWIHPDGRDRAGNPRPVVDLPAGIDVFVPGGMSEGQVAFHIVDERALVVAEFFLGTGGGGLRIADAPSMESREAFVASLQELTAWPIDHVLCVHGPPVLSTGSEAIREALSAYRG